MATAGGSHTDFNSTAFGVGAAAGSLTLAAALGAGLTNYRAQARARYERLNQDALYSALDYYDAQLDRARTEIAALRADNDRLRGTRALQTSACQAIARRTIQAR